MFLNKDLSEEVSDQPLVRRSKKNTQLNKISCFHDSYSKKKIQIERTVILPKVGCTTEIKTSGPGKNFLPIKKSKSWDTVRKASPGLKKMGLFRAHSIDVITNKMNCSSSFKNLHTIAQSWKQSDMFDSLAANLQNDNFTVDDFNCDSEYDSVKETVTILKAPNDCKMTQIGVARSFASFCEKEEAYVPHTGQAKTTRNVSILHKPKTRDKSTSTTTLGNQTRFYDHLNSSLKQLLIPYTLTGKEYPSEIILKLTPKKEVLKYIQNEASADQCKLEDSSEMNLLAPKLNSIKRKKKKQSWLLNFLFCFKKKGVDNDSLIAESLNSSTKEVYFPSVVEVYNDEKKSIKEASSVLTVNSSSRSNNIHLKHKNT